MPRSEHSKKISAVIKQAKEEGVADVGHLFDEPPCKSCEFFRPHIDWHRGEVKGLRLCVRDNMYSDFSCFRASEGDGE